MKSKWKIILITFAIIFSVVIAFAVGFNVTVNTAISYEEEIDTAKSGIGVTVKRRNELIPNLVDCIKAYDKHEYETLVKLTENRNMDSDSNVAQVEKKILAIAEAYPELKSSDNYKQFMTELSLTENRISLSRSNYNRWVTKYNTYCRTFPNKQILGFMGYKKRKIEKLKFDIDDDLKINIFEGEG